MPPFTFVGEPPQAPVGQELWQTGETRDVSEEEAALLLGNVNFVAGSAATGVASGDGLLPLSPPASRLSPPEEG